MIHLYEAVGLAGVSLSVYAYGRVQWQRDFAKTYGYSLANLASSVMIIISLSKDFNLASFASNATYILLSLYGLVRCGRYSLRQRQIERRLRSVSSSQEGQGDALLQKETTLAA